MKQALFLLAALCAQALAQDSFCFVPASTDDATFSSQVCINQDGTFNVSSELPADWRLSDVAITDLEDALSNISDALDTVWVLVAGFLVFFMQCGFAMLEAGTVSEKNVLNILYKNLMDVAIASITFFLVGYAFAYGGDGDNPFIGESNFALVDENPLGGFAGFFFQFAFAATASTIVSGSVAERCAINAYYLYSFFMSFIIYPVVVHWVWDGDGWLSDFREDPIATRGLIDFAGSGVVHMVGGFAGLVGAKILGPRLGRFDEDGKPNEEMRPHNILMQALGTLILWTGWYGFNCGSTLGAAGTITDPAGEVIGNLATLAGRVAVTTTLAAGSAGIAAAIVGVAFMKDKNPSIICNGILAGLVSITAGCATMTPGSAIAVGFIGGLLYYAFSKLILRFKIDDPLDAFPVHGGCGAWGVLAVGIFSQQEEISHSFGGVTDSIASGEQFGVQLLGVVAIAAWTVVTSSILFLTIDKTVGFRVDPEAEAKGLDITEHGGNAYTRHKWNDAEEGESDTPKKTLTDSSEESEASLEAGDAPAKAEASVASAGSEKEAIELETKE